MEEVIQILEGLKPGVDFNKEQNLFEDHILGSLEIILLVSELNDAFDIEVTLPYIKPENFRSAEAIYAMEGTLLAHTEGGVPNLIVQADGKTARSLGQLIYFFEYACGLSGYLLDVNPFDQPGVEAYKKNMFALLGKPGYESLAEELRKKLEK